MKAIWDTEMNLVAQMKEMLQKICEIAHFINWPKFLPTP
jgi:hypothetical protein